MAVEEAPRRSGRARKQVKAFAEEQAKATELAEAAQPSRGKKRKGRPVVKSGNVDAFNAHRAESQSDVDASLDQHDAPFTDDEELSPPSKKRKTSTKKKGAKNDGRQPYGAAPMGTMIEWIPGRMRKQPKIWELPRPEKASKPDWHADAAERRGEARIKAIPRLEEGEEETRILSDIDEDSDKYQKAREKARTERMVVLERSRDVEEDCHAHHDDCPVETLLISGSKGNVYTIRVSHIVTCNCPVSIFERKGTEEHCKHALYALHTVLRIPDHLQYRNSFLHSELKDIFANSPPLPAQVAEESEKDGNRKATDGDCPICFMEFEEGEELVWCKASCGNNLHAQCFKQWEKAKHPVTCPYCRAHWQAEKSKGQETATMTNVAMPTERGKGGYYNVAEQLGY
ncbi:hypothetical protein CKM354_000740200 [Cercospora kikuchii]|uniref:Uncharacterized protein n=1 Tax=Cercospora kikuchii TaxID=84275 RepID=A0A9P3CK27_9PEZI|nr:uncharacterized protein CKM354_000740200 [Cercospora kikuchii]GIZ44198.1 hypothetical protein CKM354_000740200 [Cercospora kikuchii]